MNGPTKSQAKAESNLTKLAAWIDDRNVPFLVFSVGMIVMLLWAGSFKMTVPGADGIVPLVSNSPLIWWHFKLFGPFIGSDLIGLTEWLTAVLIVTVYFKPKDRHLRRAYRNGHVLYNQHYAGNNPRCDYLRTWDSRDEVYE